jgi:crotonobetainyl-CoA:carnitine CoA-transferase CaiB-like acyl-CoA transferase
VLAALYDRTRTGRGAVIPIAMLDVVAEMMGFALNQVLHTGEEPVPLGMASSVVAPCSAYPTADGQTAVLAVTSDREWRRLTRDLLGRPELADDPRYAHNADRVRHRDELDELVRTWCAGLSLAEIQRRADDAGIGNARLNGVSELAGHPQLTARDRWRQADSPVGPVPALLPPALALGWAAVPGRVPALGADTDAIRAEVARSERKTC